jgi:polyisoprenoid-binding protein YceI
MTKFKISLLVMILGLSLLGFTAAVSVTDYTVLAAKSNITWTGYKPGGLHYGTVDVKSGSLVLKADIIQSGRIVIDMPSIKVTDSESPKLTSHLKGADFFNVEGFPTSTLVITGSESIGVDSTGRHTLQVSGNLTILGKTLPIAFSAKNIGKTANYMLYSTKIVIDRTKYGITYKSSMVGDAMINDDFDLVVKIVAKKG